MDAISVVSSTATTEELDEIDEIARASFDHPAFSAREELARPWARCWVARDAGPARAFLVAWHVADELHVLNIATAPHARRRGMAAALMRTSLDYASAHRVRILLLEVRRSNLPAIQLYRGIGFSALNVRRGYYEDNGEDAIEMILSLDPKTGEVLPGQDEIRLDAPDP